MGGNRLVHLKYLHTVTRRGREYHAYRRGGKRIPLDAATIGKPASHPDVLAAWAVVHQAYERDQARTPPPARGTMGFAQSLYLESGTFQTLAKVTRKNRAACIRRYIGTHPERPLSTVTPQLLRAALARKSPGAAHGDLKHLRAWFRWLVDAGVMDADPTEGVKASAPRTKGYEPATDADVAAYEARWKPGTMQRLAFDLARYTGQRRADLVRMGWGNVRGDVLAIEQSKTGAIAYVPLTTDLRTALEPARGRLMFLETAHGRPFTPAGLGNRFRAWSNEAGARASLHGYRKWFCTYHAERGATAHEIMAMSGHLTLAEVERYTREVAREKLARGRMGA